MWFLLLKIELQPTGKNIEKRFNSPIFGIHSAMMF
jgi:hypothetical protein